jgi:hypothetical protein
MAHTHVVVLHIFECEAAFSDVSAGQLAICKHAVCASGTCMQPYCTARPIIERQDADVHARTSIMTGAFQGTLVLTLGQNSVD